MVATERMRRNGENGSSSTPQSETARIASRGIATTTEAKRLVAQAVQDALNELIPDRKAIIAIRGVSCLVSVTRFEVGNGGPVDLVKPEQASDPLAERERELLEELEAVRKERAAK